jgi:hypothetical protein
MKHAWGGHGPPCHRQDCLCHSAERKRTLGEGHSPLRPFSSTPGGAQSSVPANFCGPRGRGPSRPGKCVGVPCDSAIAREGHSPLCHRQDCLCHSAERKRTLWEGHSPLCQQIFRPLGRRESRRGGVCGGPCDSVVPREGHRPLCHRQDCLCHSAERKRTLWEGHGPLCPFSSTPGGTQSSVPQAGLPVPRGRARTHPRGGARSSVPANSCGRRGRGPSRSGAEGTRSLPARGHAGSGWWAGLGGWVGRLGCSETRHGCAGRDRFGTGGRVRDRGWEAGLGGENRVFGGWLGGFGGLASGLL